MSDTTSRCYINEIPKAQKCWDEYRCRTPVLCMHGAVCHLQMFAIPPRGKFVLMCRHEMSEIMCC